MAASMVLTRSSVRPLITRALPSALRRQLRLGSTAGGDRQAGRHRAIPLAHPTQAVAPPIQAAVAPPPAASAGSTVGNAGAGKAEKINRAMMAYLERAEAYNQFMAEEVAEFEMGRRHLAHIMGVDSEVDFTQHDIDRAIEYLLPSGLFAKKARPKLKPPLEALPQRKAAQFGLDGRPFHCFFYTGKPNFVQTMHDLAYKLDALKQMDAPSSKVTVDPTTAATETPPDKLQLTGSQWLDRKPIETRLQESLSDREYSSLVRLLELLSAQRWAVKESETIFQFRRLLQTQSTASTLPPLQVDEESGRSYYEASGTRKRTSATVRVFERGSGAVTINRHQLLEYFPRLEDRRQVMFPLHLTSTLGSVDVEARVLSGVTALTPRMRLRQAALPLGGPPPPPPRGALHGQAAEAGAVRLALALALQPLVGPELTETMRLAGLLTRDPRLAERQKPGMQGARRRYTWKKR